MVPQDSQLTGLETDTTRQDTAVQPRSILATYLVNRFRECEIQKRVTSDREPESSAVWASSSHKFGKLPRLATSSSS